MDGGDIDVGFARRDGAFVVLAVSSTAAMPGVGAFGHPADFQGCESRRCLWLRLHLDMPRQTLAAQPSVERVIVVLVVAEEDSQSRMIFGGDFAQQLQRAAVPSFTLAAATITAIYSPNVSVSR